MNRLLAGRLPVLRLRAFRRGVLDGDRRWLALWAALATARVVQRLATPKPVVERFVLGPGQSIQITDLGSGASAAAS